MRWFQNVKYSCRDDIGEDKRLTDRTPHRPLNSNKCSIYQFVTLDVNSIEQLNSHDVRFTTNTAISGCANPASGRERGFSQKSKRSYWLIDVPIPGTVFGKWGKFGGAETRFASFSAACLEARFRFALVRIPFWCSYAAWVLPVIAALFFFGRCRTRPGSLIDNALIDKGRSWRMFFFVFLCTDEGTSCVRSM